MGSKKGTDKQSKKSKKKSGGGSRPRGKPLVHPGWYLCRSKKVIFGIRMKGGRIDFSNYTEFPIGMKWSDAVKKMERKKITYEHCRDVDPPFEDGVGLVPPRSQEPVPSRVVQRVLARVDLDPVTGCHISRYSAGSHGYAQVGWRENGKVTVTLCHLVVWNVKHGVIPVSQTVDHSCHVRKCVNIEHLRLKTNLANATDNGSEVRRFRPLTDRLCQKGHRMVLGKGGGHYCRDCKNEKRRTRRRLAALRKE